MKTGRFFVIHCWLGVWTEPGQLILQPTEEAYEDRPADEFYDPPEVSDLVATLQASDWYTIGLKLNVPFQLDNIKSNYKSYKEQKQEMFRAWLETLRENGIEPIGIASIDSPT